LVKRVGSEVLLSAAQARQIVRRLAGESTNKPSKLDLFSMRPRPPGAFAEEIFKAAGEYGWG
jgi:hypothetical protein